MYDKNCGGLSVPVKVHRGIRQGCPLSGQLYSIVIEPLLCKLRNKLTGLRVAEPDSKASIKISAYADDVTILVRGHADVHFLKDALACYGRASSAKVNWSKSKLCGVVRTLMVLCFQVVCSGGERGSNI